MAKLTQRLTGKHLVAARPREGCDSIKLNDGAGLFARVDGEKRGTFALRYSLRDGTRREAGLGPIDLSSASAAERSLRDARTKARTHLAEIHRGVDVLAVKQTARTAAKTAAKRERATLEKVATDWFAIESKASAKTRTENLESLRRHVPPAIWSSPVDSITGPALLDALRPVAAKFPVIARKVRQRLAEVFADAQFRGLCASNPADAIRRRLRIDHTVTRYASLPYSEAPAFIAKLRQMPGIAARALEFAILTTARPGEAYGCMWSEIDLAARIWTVPAERMKGREVHTVALSDAAAAVLEQMGALALGRTHVFPSPDIDGESLSRRALNAVLQRMGMKCVPHGFRATFSTWANDTDAARPDVIEACLAHREANLVRAAYNRAAFQAERAALLAKWAIYLSEVQS